jgi:hypothetical protein
MMKAASMPYTTAPPDIFGSSTIQTNQHTMAVCSSSQPK